MTQEDKASVYFDMTHRFAVPRPALTMGTYRAKVTYETRREGIASSDLVPASPASRSLLFAIN